MKTETIILSIHPCHVDKIMTGEKRFEYRKRIPTGIRYVVVYSTAPIKRIVALIEVDEILHNNPLLIWQQTKEYAGISQHYFLKYFENHDYSFAVKFKRVFKIDPGLPINVLGKENGPQSFVYLDYNFDKLKSILNISNNKRLSCDTEV